MRSFAICISIAIGAVSPVTAGIVFTSTSECLSFGVLHENQSQCSDDGAVADSGLDTQILMPSYFNAVLHGKAMGSKTSGQTPFGTVVSKTETTLSVDLYVPGPVQEGTLYYSFSQYSEDIGFPPSDWGLGTPVKSLVTAEGLNLELDSPYGGSGTTPFLVGVPFHVTLTNIVSGGCTVFGTAHPCGGWVANTSLQLLLVDPVTGRRQAGVFEVVPEPGYGGLLALLAALAASRIFLRKRLRDRSTRG